MTTADALMTRGDLMELWKDALVYRQLDKVQGRQQFHLPRYLFHNRISCLCSQNIA